MSGLITDDVMLQMVREAVTEFGVTITDDIPPRLIIPARKLSVDNVIIEREIRKFGPAVVREYIVTDVILYACNSRGTHITAKRGNETYQWCYDRMLGRVEIKP